MTDPDAETVSSTAADTVSDPAEPDSARPAPAQPAPMSSAEAAEVVGNDPALNVATKDADDEDD
jgi:hypothetical protein